MEVQSPSKERGNSKDKATTSLVSLSTKEKKNNVSSSVLLETFSTIVNAKPKGSAQLRCLFATTVVQVTLQNAQTTKHIKIQAVVIDSITSARIRIPSKFLRNIVLERGIELADNSTSERIHGLIGSDYISEILGERNIRISKRLIAVDSIFGYLIQGKEDEVNCKDIFANHLIVKNEEFDFDRVRNLW
ncbi:uncharacterized protein TNCV_2945661 [Trichonephila clavipes]|nr:uncharacterized protein TNCV_2945661 [Trichonephila clavipes]